MRAEREAQWRSADRLTGEAKSRPTLRSMGELGEGPGVLILRCDARDRLISKSLARGVRPRRRCARLIARLLSAVGPAPRGQEDTAPRGRYRRQWASIVFDSRGPVPHGRTASYCRTDTSERCRHRPAVLSRHAVFFRIIYSKHRRAAIEPLVLSVSACSNIL
jgi:hypothetical protein